MTHGDPERGGRHGDEGLKIGRQSMDPIKSFIDQALSRAKPFWFGMPRFFTYSSQPAIGIH